MGVRLLSIYVTVAGFWPAAAQDASPTATPGAACIEFNRQIVGKVESGQLASAEAALSEALNRKGSALEQSCYQMTLHNMANVIALSGRLAEAEALAEQSLRILDNLYPSDSPFRFRPLQLLWSVQSQQGKRSKARQTFQNMRSLRLDQPRDRAMLYSAVAAQFQVDGQYKEAETEYFKAIAAWEESGRGESAEMAATITGLGTLQLVQDRYRDARMTLERALAIVSSAKDAIPMDVVNIHCLLASLHARQGNWQVAEENMKAAISLADRDARLDPAARKFMLLNFAYILRKAHRAKEARTIEARAASINAPGSTNAIVDVSEFLEKARIRK